MPRPLQEAQGLRLTLRSGALGPEGLDCNCRAAAPAVAPTSQPDDEITDEDWDNLLLEIAQVYALIDNEWLDADKGNIGEFDPWDALRKIKAKLAAPQPSDERADWLIIATALCLKCDITHEGNQVLPEELAKFLRETDLAARASLERKP